jgi:DNA-binding SARP family transcriptional activator
MEFRILGPLEVVDDGRDVTPARPKQRALLALLLLHVNEVVASEDLVDALWGEEPPETALTALHGHVSSLRKLLGAEAIETRPPGYVLRLPPTQIDLGRFEAIVEEARSQRDEARKSELLRTGLSLFRGEPLSDFRYAGFAREQAARIEELRLAALEARIEAELALGRHHDVIPELERLVTTNPLRERLRGQLMLAFYRAGRQADALHAYQEARHELAEVLGLDPGPGLKELERKILGHDPSLEPPAPVKLDHAQSARRERKLVTVLFCDLVGFTARSETLDPEDVQALLHPYFAKVRAELERFGGTVEKFIGDAVMAVFGAPTAHEDDPERAVRAALAIRDALADELELRIAVNTGEALVTLDSDPRSGEGIVAGDVVNTASRLQAGAPPNAVIVGEQTHRASADAIAYRELEPVHVRGKREPLRVWEAVALRPTRADRPAASLVGRRRELDQLADLLARAQAERAPQLVTVVGVPGIGKTRLVGELYRLVEAAPAEIGWLVGRSLPYGEGVTFWALGEIVKAQAGVFEGDPPAIVDEKLRLAVEETLGDEREREWVLRHLRALLGLGGDHQARGDRRGEAFAAWRLFVEALADEAPLVLVVEDLHWADEDLLDFVDELGARATDAPLLIVATSRPELLARRPGWGGGKPNATTISLAPLSEDEIEHLLEELLQGNVDRALVHRAHGNPLYAEEYARLVLERGGEDGSRVPESLHALIAARLDGLAIEEKALVQDAAVLGEVAWAGAIAAVGGRERAAVEELALSLERKEFLRRRRHASVEGETEYLFHHVLVRDVAYGQIPRAERADKHRLAAEWIESLGRREDHVELLAHHYLHALELARAVGDEAAELEERARLAFHDAGDRAAVLGAFPTAARFYAQALELLPDDDPARGRLLLRRARALLIAEVAGEQELLAAAEWLSTAGDRAGAAEAEALLVALFQEEGRGALMDEHLDRAQELVADLPPSTEKAAVLLEVCRSRMMSGEPGEALAAGGEALVICEELGLDEIRATVLNCMGPSRLAAGDAAAGLADLERGIALAESLGSYEAVHGLGNLADARMALGDLQGSYEARRAALEQGERLGLRLYVRWLRIVELDELYFTSGAWDELLERVEELVPERTILAVPAFVFRARVLLARGDVGAALVDVDRLLALTEDVRDDQVVMPALAIAAFARLTAGDGEACADLADELLAFAHWESLLMQGYSAPTVGFVVHALGRGDELAARVAGVRNRTPWLEAGLAAASGDLVRAADVYELIGARPDEAYARLKASEQLIAEGRSAEAGEQLERALAFFRAVGATAYALEAEALAAAARATA